VLCCSSSCATFDFASCCCVRLIPIERWTSVNYKFNQWFGRHRCRSGSMSMLLTWVLWVCSHIHSLHF